jgi:hypothetical protein
MKTKLTVTVDEELLPRAKEAAKEKGVSLSQYIENALRELTSGPRKSFSEEWRGAFRPADRKDARYRALAKKYL